MTDLTPEQLQEIRKVQGDASARPRGHRPDSSLLAMLPPSARGGPLALKVG